MGKGPQQDLVLGDKVIVHDTSNGRDLTGYVRQFDGQRTQVYIERFKNSMWFNGVKTGLGRFQLQGRDRGPR